MLRNATAADIKFVVDNMQSDDVKELWKATGKPATQAVEDLGKYEYVAFTLFKDEPIAIFGATLHGGGLAEMFRFATPRWPEVVREAMKAGRRLMLPMFVKSGIRRLVAQTLADSDTTWLRVFGAKQTGGFTTNDCQFKTFAVDLLPPLVLS